MWRLQWVQISKKKLGENLKLPLFSYPLLWTYVLGAQKTVSLRRFSWVPTTYVLVEKWENQFRITVKPVLSSHLKIDKTKVSVEYGSLMKVKNIAE